MHKSDPTGFEGLSSFVTDADSAIAEADRIAASAPQTLEPTRQSGPPADPTDRDGGEFIRLVKKIGGWVLAIGVLLAIKACFFAGSNLVSDGTSPGYEDNAVVESRFLEDEVDSTTNADVSEDPSTSAGSDESDTSVSSVGDSGEEEGSVVDASTESRPAPGGDVLTLAEIQYCLAEDIRLSGQKSRMDQLQYIDPDRFNRNVDGFNSAVSDYNSECSNRSVVTSQRIIAEERVESRRYQLESEGRSRVQ